MKILAVDIGTGTQDIYLYNSHTQIENGYKLVLPAPTMIIHRRLQQATRQRQAVLLQGVTMGGGPSGWAAEAHLRAGLPLFATPDAARTFNDDLDAVAAMGVTLVSPDEAARLPASVQRIELLDFDFPAIQAAFQPFGVSLDDLDGVAVCVFDHGAAPADVSDRQFRFDYIAERIQADQRLSTFAWLAGTQPACMTRLSAVAASAGDLACPLLLMDSAPAAVLGASFDPVVRARRQVIIANVGNFHTLAFRLNAGCIEGVFEHHTGHLTTERLDELIRGLVDGSLTHAAVFNDHGHGAWVKDGPPFNLSAPGVNVVVTGPRRSLLQASGLRPYFAVPFGDMMIAGCFGLLAACADKIPAFSEPILASLQGLSATSAPWDVPA